VCTADGRGRPPCLARCRHHCYGSGQQKRVSGLYLQAAGIDQRRQGCSQGGVHVHGRSACTYQAPDAGEPALHLTATMTLYPTTSDCPAFLADVH
jgi:hypothetical protein